MISSLKRNRPLKKWTQIYTERIDETLAKKHQISEEMLDDDVSLTQASALVEKLAQFTIVHNFDKKHSDCKHSIDNVTPPPKQADWHAHWGTQLMCHICKLPGLNNCSVCKKCNIIAHSSCISKKKQLTGRSLFVKHSKDQKEYNCPNCEQSLVDDLKYYEKLVTRLREERLHDLCSRMIAKRMLIYMEKKKLLKKRKAIVKLQSIFRQRLERVKYLTWRKSLLRVIIIEVKSLPQKLMGDNMVVILTALDTFRNVQLFRFDKTPEETLREGFFIPGITAHMSIIVTFGIKEDAHQCTLLGQARLFLRDIVNFEVKRTFTMNIVQKISFAPQELKHSLFTYHLSISPVGSTYSNFFPVLGNQSPQYIEENTLTLNYMPQNVISSMCRMVSAPPLDILRRSVDLGMKAKKMKGAVNTMASSSNIANYRNSRYWLTLYKLKLLLYQYYGDIVPRFITDISEVTAQVVKDKGRTTSLVNLIHSDNRIWLIEFASKNDANKFEFAVNESRRAKNEVKGSRFLHSSDFHVQDVSLGFV